METQIQTYNPQDILVFNSELPIRKHPCLIGETINFVFRINTICNLKTDAEVLQAISEEVYDYFNKAKMMFTFNEFCNIVRSEIMKNTVYKIDAPLFISTFENYLKENKHFKSKAVVSAPPSYEPVKLNMQDEVNAMYRDYVAGKLSDIEIEFRLPNAYPYLRAKRLCEFTEEQKKAIIGEKYISQKEAEEALRNGKNSIVVQFNKNKGLLVLEQFKITKNSKK
jgi:hypothetical protein